MGLAKTVLPKKNKNKVTDIRELIIVVIILTFGLASVLVAGRIPRNEEAGEAFTVLIFIYYLVGFIAYKGFVNWRKLRLIRNTPTSKIRSLAMGTVEIKGEVRKGLEDLILEAPFSGDKCLFYKYEIEEFRGTGRRKRWDTIDEGQIGVRFWVDDGTGKVIVDPEGAELELPYDNEIRVDSEEEETQEIREFLGRNDISGPGGILADNDRRYKEYYVTPGEYVYVFGYASTETLENKDYPVIKEDERQEMFMISDKSEKRLKNSKELISRIQTIGGALTVFICYTFLLFLAGVL